MQFLNNPSFAYAIRFCAQFGESNDQTHTNGVDFFVQAHCCKVASTWLNIEGLGFKSDIIAEVTSLSALFNYRLFGFYLMRTVHE